MSGTRTQSWATVESGNAYTAAQDSGGVLYESGERGVVSLF